MVNYKNYHSTYRELHTWSLSNGSYGTIYPLGVLPTLPCLTVIFELSTHDRCRAWLMSIRFVYSGPDSHRGIKLEKLKNLELYLALDRNVYMDVWTVI